MTKSAVKSTKFIQDAEYYISQGLSTTVYASHNAMCGTMEDYTMALINRFKYYPKIRPPQDDSKRASLPNSVVGIR